MDTTLAVRDAEETGLLEGSRALKYNGKYYLLMISWPNGGKRRQLCYRADKITGPYEKKVILCDNYAGFPYVGQGTIVDDAQGNWYGWIFQDRGAIGRVPTLSPCRWVDGWPIIGDAEGHVPTTMTLPLKADKKMPLVVDDEFSKGKMKLQWQWNHNPVDEAYSLTERKGYLRLKTNKVVQSVFEARNTLTQRMEGPKCSGVVAMDVSRMADGDRAGFSAFNDHAGLLEVARDGEAFTLSMKVEDVRFDRDKRVTGVESKVGGTVDLGKARKVYLRIDADFRLGQDLATFFYSLDGKDWTPLGEAVKMRFDFRKFFMGTKFGIFNYATKAAGGYVDVDYFRYEKDESNS